MKKLIEITQEYSIVCDNKECDYKVINENSHIDGYDTIKYVDLPCPKCGENLLTKEDYLQSIKILKVVNWINKWFSWTTIFLPKNPKDKKYSVHVHEGVKFTETTDNV